MEQDILIYVDENDKLNAAALSNVFTNNSVKYRAYINALGAELVMKYLKSENIDVENICNIHSIKKVLEDIDISDIMLKTCHIDVRVVFDENIIFVPKSHFEYGVVPDVYVVMQLSKDLSNMVFLGFFEPDVIDKNKCNSDYYFVDKDQLQSAFDFVKYLNENNHDYSQELPEEILEDSERIILSMLDNDISEDTKKALIRNLTKSSALRDKFMEYEIFEVLSSKAVSSPDIEKFKPKQDTTVTDEFEIFEAQKDEGERESSEILINEGALEDDNIIEAIHDIKNQDIQDKGLIDTESINDTIDRESDLEIIQEIENVEDLPLIEEDFNYDVEYKDTDDENPLFDIDPSNDEPIEDTFGEIIDDDDKNSIDLGSLDELPVLENNDNTVNKKYVPKDEDTEGLEILEIAGPEPDDEDYKITLDLDSEDFTPFTPIDDDFLNAGDLNVPDIEDIAEEINETDAVETEKLQAESHEPEIIRESVVDNVEDINSDIVAAEDEVSVNEQEENNIETAFEDVVNQEESVNVEPVEVEIDKEQDKEAEVVEQHSEEVEPEAEDTVVNEIEQEIEAEVGTETEHDLQEAESLEEFYEKSDKADDLLGDMSEDIDMSISEIDRMFDDNEISSDSEMSSEEFMDKMKSVLDETEEASSLATFFNPKKDDKNKVKKDKKKDKKKEKKKDAVQKQSDKNGLKKFNDKLGILYNNLKGADKDKPSQKPQELQKFEAVVSNAKKVVNFDKKKIAIAAIVVFTAATAFGIFQFLKLKAADDNMAQSGITDIVPEVVNTDDISEQKDIQNTIDNNVPDVAAKKQPDIEKTNIKVQAPKTTSKELKTNTVRNQDSDVYLSVNKLIWNVPETLSDSTAMQSYLKSAGRSIKLSLNTDLLLAREYAYSNRVKVDLVVDKNGSIKSSKVAISSGSTEIDNIVLRSVKDTLNVVKPPSNVIVTPDFNLSLIIYF